MVAGETAPERVLCLLVESCKIWAHWGACFASTIKTARNSVFGFEIIQNVGIFGISDLLDFASFLNISINFSIRNFPKII